MDSPLEERLTVFAEEFLARFGSSLPELVEEITELIPDGAIVALCGSVAEGTANDDSDVDLLLIAEALAPTGHLVLGDDRVEVSTIMHESGLEISIERFEPAELERLTSAMASVVGVIDSSQDMQRFPFIYDNGDRKLLHRLRTSIPLVGADRLHTLRESLKLDRLPQVAALTWMFDHFAHREDGISHIQFDDDLDSASLCLMRASADAAGALLASHGETNPDTRWAIRLLRSAVRETAVPEVEELIDAMLSRVRTVEDFDHTLTLLDSVVVQVALSTPSIVPVLEQLADAYPVHTHRQGDAGPTAKRLAAFDGRDS